MGQVMERFWNLIRTPGRKVSRYLRGTLAARVEELQEEIQQVKKTVEELQGQVEKLVTERKEKAPAAVQEEEEQEASPAQTVRAIREEYKISREELAELLEVSPKTVASWESGRSKPGAENRTKVARLEEESREDMEEALGRARQETEFTPEEIAELRRQLDMSQAALAEALDVSPNTVWKWENARSRPNGSSVEALRGLQGSGEEQISEAPEPEEEPATGEESERAVPFTGQDIGDLRKEVGLSQKELAEQLEVSAKTISNWETGKTSPRGKNLENLRAFREGQADNASSGFGIRVFRKRAGLSQKQLAEKLDVSATTISNWETGKTRPRGKSLEKLKEFRGEQETGSGSQ